MPRLGFHFTAITFSMDRASWSTEVQGHAGQAAQERPGVRVQAGTTNEKNLADFSRTHKLNIKPVVFDSFEAAFKALFSGRCQAYTADASGLSSVRNKEAPRPTTT